MALKEKYQDKVSFIVADIDEPQGLSLAEEFRVTSIPAIYFINSGGKVVDQVSGSPSYSDLEIRVEALLKDNQVEEKGLNQFIQVTIPEAMEKGLLITFLFVFFGGLITSISPCIFAMIPIMVGYIGGYSQTSKAKGFLLALLFVLGLSTTFAILGTIAALIGKIFGQFGSGLYYIMALAAIILGMNLLGVIKLNLPGLKTLPFSKSGYLGAYLTGLFFGLVASPCTTPVLAVIMAYVATQGEIYYGAALLFVYGLGHGVPLLIIGTFTALIKNIDKVQRYSHLVTYFSGALLIIIGLYFLYNGLR